MKLSRTPVLGAVAVLSALALAACGSSTSSSSSPAAAGTAAGAGSAQRAKLVACLKAHGVTVPARPARPPGAGAPGGGYGRPPGAGGGLFGGGGGRFAANPRFRAAVQACGGRALRPGARFSPVARQAAIVKFVACVSTHGYKLPKPNFSGNGPVFPAGIQGNARFRSAAKACQGVLVTPRPAGAAGAGPPST